MDNAFEYMNSRNNTRQRHWDLVVVILASLMAQLVPEPVELNYNNHYQISA
jgi:hypothetical protein